MKVISGFLKGRKILGYEIKGTRPTMDRVKESLFATIQNEIKNSICLDLFAGSGNLGIEAISNGAKYVYFVDNNKESIKVINNNIDNFKINDKCQVINNDYMKVLKYLNENNIKLDLIFIDPPYKLDIINEILLFIDSNNMLNKSGQVICEYENATLNDAYGNLKVIKIKKYGYKFISIYKSM